MTEPLLTGDVVFEGARAFRGARVRVALEDVTRVDAASTTVSEVILDGISHDPDAGGALAFSLPGILPDERARYAVRVHVDVDGDGLVSRGDYITMESFPVLTHGYPNRVTVRVREVG